MRYALCLLAVLFAVSGCAQHQSNPYPLGMFGSPLSDLAKPHAGVAKHEGSWDRNGGNGDARPVAPGETVTLLDYQGAGCIKRFWVTIAPRAEMHIHRQAILRMYWDGETTPSVECPIGDFFGVGFGEQKDYISLPLNETSGGYNCYWPMPFHKSARWTLENRSDKRIDAFYYNIDFIAYDSLPKDTRHFHAQWRRENPTTPNQNYTILDTTGEGHFVGVAMFMQARKPHDIGFLEGDEMVYVDGESNILPVSKTPNVAYKTGSTPPAPSTQPSVHKTTFVGTGTEDLFSSGWYYDRGTYSAPFHGCIIKDEINARISTYRWYIEDAIPFTKSIKYTLEHGTQNERDADYSSVAYFYASGNVTPAPPQPTDAKDLLPQGPRVVKHYPGAIEAETLAGTMVTGGNAQIQTMGAFAGDWSGEAQLFWINTKPGQSMTINLPVKDAGEYELIAHFTKAPDYAAVRVQVGNGTLGMPIDLYDPKVVTSGPVSLGKAKLPAGDTKLTFTITGKNEKSTNTLVGIDCFELRPVK